MARGDKAVRWFPGLVTRDDAQPRVSRGGGAGSFQSRVRLGSGRAPWVPRASGRARGRSPGRRCRGTASLQAGDPALSPGTEAPSQLPSARPASFWGPLRTRGSNRPAAPWPKRVLGLSVRHPRRHLPPGCGLGTSRPQPFRTLPGRPDAVTWTAAARTTGRLRAGEPAPPPPPLTPPPPPTPGGDAWPMSRAARPEAAEAEDMAEGDLGYGLRGRPGVGHRAPGALQPRSPNGRSPAPPASQASQEVRSGQVAPRAPRLIRSNSDPNSEMASVELRQHLHETLEEVETLKTELEAVQRQLEGKEEALKILQSMAVFGKATSHTQELLQKTVQQKASLEKEINGLQWKIELDQNTFKNMEESWTQKYDRLTCENAILKETLKLKTEEVKMLISKNAMLTQQYLEALAMLDLNQRKMVQENRSKGSGGCTEVSGLELAVPGTCHCRGPQGSPCSCARTAAATRKLLLQLQQELELLQKSKEEAYIMADAFRIAFEHQLMRKNDQALRWTQTDQLCSTAKQLTCKHLKEDEPPSPRSKNTLRQKLLRLLPSEHRSKKREDQGGPQEVFEMLMDLLNDKEEALAHQRKVSYMLARALEDKDTSSKENKEKNSLRNIFPLKSPFQNTSGLSALCDPVHASVPSFHSVSCICSIQHLHTDQNLTRSLKRSCSLPSSIMFGS